LDIAAAPSSNADAEASVPDEPVALTGEASAAPAPEAAADIAAIRPDLSIKAAEAEARRLYVAGEAAPGTLVRVYADEDLIGEARTNRDGTWLVEAAKEVSVGQVLIRADAVARNPAAPSAQVELPFIRYADGIVLEPAAAVADAGDSSQAVAAGLPSPTYVLIRRGDNLWRISRRKYGRGIRFKAIFAANRDRIRNPHRIYPGQVFVLPKRDTSWETATN
jgi:nucleoid-associated protein YgaU